MFTGAQLPPLPPLQLNATAINVNDRFSLLLVLWLLVHAAEAVQQAEHPPFTTSKRFFSMCVRERERPLFNTGTAQEELNYLANTCVRKDTFFFFFFLSSLLISFWR